MKYSDTCSKAMLRRAGLWTGPPTFVHNHSETPPREFLVTNFAPDLVKPGRCLATSRQSCECRGNLGEFCVFPQKAHGTPRSPTRPIEGYPETQIIQGDRSAPRAPTEKQNENEVRRESHFRRPRGGRPDGSGKDSRDKRPSMAPHTERHRPKRARRKQSHTRRDVARIRAARAAPCGIACSSHHEWRAKLAAWIHASCHVAVRIDHRFRAGASYQVRLRHRRSGWPMVRHSGELGRGDMPEDPALKIVRATVIAERAAKKTGGPALSHAAGQCHRNGNDLNARHSHVARKSPAHGSDRCGRARWRHLYLRNPGAQQVPPKGLLRRLGLQPLTHRDRDGARELGVCERPLHRGFALGPALCARQARIRLSMACVPNAARRLITRARRVPPLLHGLPNTSASPLDDGPTRRADVGPRSTVGKTVPMPPALAGAKTSSGIEYTIAAPFGSAQLCGRRKGEPVRQDGVAVHRAPHHAEPGATGEPGRPPDPLLHSPRLMRQVPLLAVYPEPEAEVAGMLRHAGRGQCEAGLRP